SGFGTQMAGVEMQMLQMVNVERSQAGLPPFAMDPALCAVARGHSQDMAANGYFDHTSPTQGTCQNRIHRAGLAPGSTAENIALASNLQEAHQTLMLSPAHRDHILAIRYNLIGIGVAQNAAGRLLVTQVFRSGTPARRRPAAKRALSGSAEQERTVDV